MNLIEKLRHEKNLTDSEFKKLLETSDYDRELFSAANEVRIESYGTDIFIRGLIEFSNYCKNNCYYCGIRRDNSSASRYRMNYGEIMECVEVGYGLGFRTFVLQSGDDGYYTDDKICEIISGIKSCYPDCAITLSTGERPYESYKKYYASGMDRFLLRHETASEEHYSKLHPESMKGSERKKCLMSLKKVGCQVGSGFMVGSPFQTTENIIEDLHFLHELKPDMIGIGPYLRHEDTPFCDCENGGLELSLRLISILRLMFPKANIPATTALGTLSSKGREKGLLCGANVIMPNLTPMSYRKKYSLYDNKISIGEETAERLESLKISAKKLGYQIVIGRGDAKTK